MIDFSRPSLSLTTVDDVEYKVVDVDDGIDDIGAIGLNALAVFRMARRDIIEAFFIFDGGF